MLNVHRFGPEDAPPIVLLHGVTGHGRRWVRFAEEGLAGRRVLAPDLRGHGRSPWEPPWTVEQHIADLVEMLDSEGVPSAPVVGHSMGGCIGINLAVTAPERVSRLVMLDPVLGLEGPAALAWAESSRVDDGWTSEDEARAARREGHPQSAYPAIDLDLADVGSSDGDGRFRLRFCRSAAACGWSEMAKPPPDLSHHEVPTLVVVADEGGYDPGPLLRALEPAPGSVTVEHFACGHMLYWDAFDETARLVASFTAS